MDDLFGETAKRAVGVKPLFFPARLH